jgi:hypothetical protein
LKKKKFVNVYTKKNLNSKWPTAMAEKIHVQELLGGSGGVVNYSQKITAEVQ